MIKRGITHKTIILSTILLAACLLLSWCGEKGAFDGSKISDEMGFRMEYSNLDKVESAELKLTEGDQIQVHISHTAGSENVAGMTVFYMGKPLKSAYKKFRIKGFSGQDDYRSMAEVVDRRFTEYKKAVGSGETEGFATLPDLILLDGGKGHVSKVRELMKEIGCEIPVFGMVKDEFHKTRALCTDTEEISIAREQAVYGLVFRIQEEVHRYTVSKMSNAKSKTIKRSSLENIKGIGPSKAKALLAHFGGVSAIKSASFDELIKTKGISEQDARNILDYYGD